MPIAFNVVKLDVAGDAAVAECEREAGTVDVIRMLLPCAAAVGKGINTPKYPTFPDIVKARKKEVKKMALDALGLEDPGGKLQLLHLAPALEDRQPKDISGAASEVARQIVGILKNEAKVI
jgi:electron transfer flavoprotein beta subunit